MIKFVVSYYFAVKSKQHVAADSYIPTTLNQEKRPHYVILCDGNTFFSVERPFFRQTNLAERRVFNCSIFIKGFIFRLRNEYLPLPFFNPLLITTCQTSIDYGSRQICYRFVCSFFIPPLRKHSCVVCVKLNSCM